MMPWSMLIYLQTICIEYMVVVEMLFFNFDEKNQKKQTKKNSGLICINFDKNCIM